LFKHREILIAHLIGWVLYGLLEHLSHLVYDENHWQGSLGGALIGALLTALIAFNYERMHRYSLWQRILVFILLGFITSIIWHNSSRLLHQQKTLQELFSSDISALLSGGSYTVLLFAAWAGLYFGICFYLQKNQQVKNSLVLSEQAKEAQLQSLRYQLNPHFLFNVLNSIDVAVQEQENDTAHNMIVKLSRLLRVTLETDAIHKISLREEISLLDDFIAIEKERYVESILFEKNISEQSKACLVPSLLLQPLIENAIKFTWQATYNKKIELHTSLVGNQLIIELINPYEQNSNNIPDGTNTGLNNVIKRITALYGNRASLATYKDANHFKLLLKLPQEKH